MSLAGSIENHRQREKGIIIYPVYSRRSDGLSIGINLFPGEKCCTFNCPYCEVFPFTNDTVFSLSCMEEDLRSEITSAIKQNIPIKDICFSGNGEPSLSPFFGDALKIASKVRNEMAAFANLVLITNGTGLLQMQIFSLLKEAACEKNSALDIWLKFDAGTEGWYKKMNRSEIIHNELIAKIKEFAYNAPVTLQTMLCAIEGSVPPPDEEMIWEKMAVYLAGSGNIRKVQIYGKARPSPEDPLSSRLPAEYLESRASNLRRTFTENGILTPIEIYL